MAKSITRLNMQMANWAMSIQASYENARIHSNTQKSIRLACPSQNLLRQTPPRKNEYPSVRKEKSRKRKVAKSGNPKRIVGKEDTPRPPHHHPVLVHDRPLLPPRPLLPNEKQKGNAFLRCRKNIHSELSSITETGPVPYY